jgi:hypothetical protein
MTPRLKLASVMSALLTFGATSCGEAQSTPPELASAAEESQPREVTAAATGEPGATKVLVMAGGRDAIVSGPLTRVGDCAGIGDAVAAWPLGTKVVSESPLTLRIPGLGAVSAGESLKGAGGVFDAAIDQVGFKVPTSCGTTEVVTFRVE